MFIQTYLVQKTQAHVKQNKRNLVKAFNVFIKISDYFPFLMASICIHKPTYFWELISKFYFSMRFWHYYFLSINL